MRSTFRSPSNTFSERIQTYHCTRHPPPILSFPPLSAIGSLWCTSLDLSGHGDTERGWRPGALDMAKNVHWGEFGKDILSTFDNIMLSSSSSSPPFCRPDIVVGVGVSLGGAAMIDAQSMRPIFDHLVLIEPIIIPSISTLPRGSTALGDKTRARKNVSDHLLTLRTEFQASLSQGIFLNG